MQSLPHPCNYEEWRAQALALIDEQTAPDEVFWEDSHDQSSLFESAPPPNVTAPPQTSALKISMRFIRIAKAVACHTAPDRWGLLYRVLWRMTQLNERTLLDRLIDSDTQRILQLEKNIGRDVHKMHAFVRFRKVELGPETARETFIAWYEPDFTILAHTANFFVKRFNAMNWSIISPVESIRWDGERLHIGAGGQREDAPSEDACEDLWLSYYKSIFNPARLKLKAMQSEMPKKFWKNLPESVLIESLTQTAGGRVSDMLVSEPTPPKPAPKNKYLNDLLKKNHAAGQ